MERFYEIDGIRGMAIISMIALHVLLDLWYFGIVSFEKGLLWRGAMIATASAFLLIVGVSLTISHSRVRDRPGKQVFRKYLLRGAKIFSLGLLITLVTSFVMEDGVILFGVLHLIGVSVVLSYPLLRYRYANLFLGITVITAGLFVSGMRLDHPWLLWLGFPTSGIYMFDYFPLMPWFGVVLVGLFLGNTLYPGGKRSFTLKGTRGLPLKFSSWLGRNSLFLYLAHQPLIFIIFSKTTIVQTIVILSALAVYIANNRGRILGGLYGKK